MTASNVDSFQVLQQQKSKAAEVTAAVAFAAHHTRFSRSFSGLWEWFCKPYNPI